MKLIVGLGNPGLRYRNTRHNVGFMALDNFSRKHKAVLKSGEAALLKPQLFMNNSGIAIARALRKFKIALSDMLVVCDDINLALGVIRLRSKGSAGGHKGLQSIINELGTADFNRLRIGIGAKEGPVLKDYVLSGFKSGERNVLKDALDRSSEAIEVWIDDGIETAMNKFNQIK